jgi:hypothetical protein
MPRERMTASHGGDREIVSLDRKIAPVMARGAARGGRRGERRRGDVRRWSNGLLRPARSDFVDSDSFFENETVSKLERSGDRVPDARSGRIVTQPSAKPNGLLPRSG